MGNNYGAGGELFRDRREAGQILAKHLRHYAKREDVIALALPRGGVPVAYEVAQALQIPLEVFVVRKLGVPGAPELAMGAIASGGVRVVNEDVMLHVARAEEVLEEVTKQERRELDRREAEYSSGRPKTDLTGKTVILIDDGLATGATMRAAVKAVRKRGVERCVVAVPVAASETYAVLRAEADEIICPQIYDTFCGVGQFYEDFSQTSDEEVRNLLARAARGGERK
jgi:predicted phosphoribosyltransferase